MQHKSGECTGEWRIKGDPVLPDEQKRILCPKCGAAYRWTEKRFRAAMWENVCGLMAKVLSHEGQKKMKDEV
jgi:hypothetical protein